jgi:hypothetical protein
MNTLICVPLVHPFVQHWSSFTITKVTVKCKLTRTAPRRTCHLDLAVKSNYRLDWMGFQYLGDPWKGGALLWNVSLHWKVVQWSHEKWVFLWVPARYQWDKCVSHPTLCRLAEVPLCGAPFTERNRKKRQKIGCAPQMPMFPIFWCFFPKVRVKVTHSQISLGE